MGQLIAETLRLYGSRFLLALPLGIPLAAVNQIALSTGHSRESGSEIVVETGPSADGLILLLAAPAFSLAFAAACALTFRVVPSRRQAVWAVLVGTVAFAPAALFFPWFALASVAWLAIVGHVVPAIVKEGHGPLAALRRSVQLARADYVHALGGLAALVVLFGLTRIVMAQLLRSQADNTLRVAVGLADLVLSPLLYLGGALLFLNLAARVGLDREQRRAVREEAIRAMQTGPGRQ